MGEREDLLTQEAIIADVRIRDWEWLNESPEVLARIRYKSPAVEAQLSLKAGPLPDECNVKTIHFATPVWGVTPGQSLVIYKDNLVVGGGRLVRKAQGIRHVYI